MSEVNVTIHGNQYNIACDAGQEQRVHDLANFVNARVSEIAPAGSGVNDKHALVLTSIVMADELFDSRDAATNGNKIDPNTLQITQEDEGQIVDAIDHMMARIDKIAGGLGGV